MSTMRNGKRHTPDKSKIPAALQGVEWRPIRKTDDLRGIDVSDGMSILVAVPVVCGRGNDDSKWFYELSVVDISCDEDSMSVCCQGDPWGWDLDDADWYVLLSR